MANVGHAQDGRNGKGNRMTDNDTDANNTGYVKVAVGTRDFILKALRETNQQLSKTHRMRATPAILVEEGVKLTEANSFTIDHRDQQLLMSLAENLLAKAGE